MEARCPGEGPEVPCIGGEDVVAVDGEADESGIDGVAGPAPPEEQPGPLTQLLVEAPHVDAGKEPCHLGLPPRPAAPDLGHDTAVADGRSLSKTLPLQERDHVTVTPLDRQEGSRVEKQAHATPRCGLPLGAGADRTTVARERVRRTASSISASVIVPWRAS